MSVASVVGRRLIPAFAIACVAVMTAGAQSPNRALVRVTVRDSTGAPVAGAELTIKSGIRTVLAQSATDSGGHSVLSVDTKDSTDLQVTMRKIGYPRSDRFFEIGPRGTADVMLTVPTRRATDLAPVTVTAKRDLKRASYHLDADQIDSAALYVDNAWELIKRMRPDMLTSRGGCDTGAQEVWVNGKRIRLPLRPTGMAAARAFVGVPPRARFSYIPVSVMSDIAPEHIQEINYHDCFDHSMAAVGNNNAIFIVLKPGVMYKQDVGSFVLDIADTRANKK